MTTATTEAHTFDVTDAGLYPKQADAIFHPARYCIIEASTKSGKTHGCIVWLVAEALKGGPNKEYWWIAPIFSQAKIANIIERVGRDGSSMLVVTTETTYTDQNGERLCILRASGIRR